MVIRIIGDAHATCGQGTSICGVDICGVVVHLKSSLSFGPLMERGGTCSGGTEKWAYISRVTHSPGSKFDPIGM